jgi:polysaccharide biosynthesis transport protein
VEREYSTLAREYDLLQAEYRALRAKQSQASRAETLEAGDTGERLSIIDPATLPSSPIQPNRASLSFLGIVLALAVFLGLASLTRIRGHDGAGAARRQRPARDAAPRHYSAHRK